MEVARQLSDLALALERGLLGNSSADHSAGVVFWGGGGTNGLERRHDIELSPCLTDVVRAGKTSRICTETSDWGRKTMI